MRFGWCFMVGYLHIEGEMTNQLLLWSFNKIDAYLDYWRGRSNDRKNQDTLRLKSGNLLGWVVWEKNALFISATNKENLRRVQRTRIWSGKTHSRHRFPYNKFLYPDYKDAVEKDKGGNDKKFLIPLKT
jgi:GTP-binding protein HflX